MQRATVTCKHYVEADPHSLGRISYALRERRRMALRAYAAAKVRKDREAALRASQEADSIAMELISLEWDGPIPDGF